MNEREWMALYPGWDTCSLGFWEDDPEKEPIETTRRVEHFLIGGLFSASNLIIEYEPVTKRFLRRRVSFFRTSGENHKTLVLDPISIGVFSSVAVEAPYTLTEEHPVKESMSVWERDWVLEARHS